MAEVLITLGIIGVVAAMTMPALVKNYKKQQTITALRKAYSVINQSLKLSIAENGTPASWVEINAPVSYTTTLKYFNKYIKPYYKIAKICTGESSYITNDYQNCGYAYPQSKRAGGWQNAELWRQNGNRAIFATPDGMVYFVYPYGTFCTELENSTYEDPKYDCYASSNGTVAIAVDINGAKEPNTWGKDLFVFNLNSQKETFFPDGKDNTAEEIDRDCNKNNYQGGFCCAAKLMKDGWVMKEDYPW